MEPSQLEYCAQGHCLYPYNQEIHKPMCEILDTDSTGTREAKRLSNSSYHECHPNYRNGYIALIALTVSAIALLIFMITKSEEFLIGAGLAGCISIYYANKQIKEYGVQRLFKEAVKQLREARQEDKQNTYDVQCGLIFNYLEENHLDICILPKISKKLRAILVE